MKTYALAFLILGACSSDPAAPAVDAPAGGNKVVTVSCSTVTPSATIMTIDASDSYMPATATITQGQTVQFMMSGTHNVAPVSGNDPGLTIGFGATGCLMFTAPGTYKFTCSTHGFVGTVTVN